MVRKSIPLIFFLILLLTTSGCVKQTGETVKKPGIPDISDSEVVQEVNETNGTEEILNQTIELEENISVNETLEGVCKLECKECEELNITKCGCEKTKPCCGNDVCEFGEDHERCEADCHKKRVLFSEVCYNALNPENKKEWFELYNPTGKEVELTDYTITDNDYFWTFPSGVVIPAGKYLTVARDKEGFYELFACYPDIENFTRTLNNKGDVLILRDHSGNIIDQVSWEGYENSDLFADEGRSIQRILSKDFSGWTSNQTPNPENCLGKECLPSVTICPDGYESRCSNKFINGECERCEPSCEGHEVNGTCEENWSCGEWKECIGGEQTRECIDLNSCNTTENKPSESQSCECEVICGMCEELDAAKCVCYEVSPCDGNGICEEGEYEISLDCPNCNDGDNCTDDFYNYTLQECGHTNITPCCGNGECEFGENQTSCPEDCEGLDHLIFAEVMYDTSIRYDHGEWIKIYNPLGFSVNLTNWTIEDNSGSWKFPEGVMIDESSFLTITKNETWFYELFNCSPDVVGFSRGLNNNGDQLILKDFNSNEIDFVAWESGYNNTYTDWNISASEDKTIKRFSLKNDSDSSVDWLSNQNPEVC
jgi:hypothetical protein